MDPADRVAVEVARAVRTLQQRHLADRGIGIAGAGWPGSGVRRHLLRRATRVVDGPGGAQQDDGGQTDSQEVSMHNGILLQKNPSLATIGYPPERFSVCQAWIHNLLGIHDLRRYATLQYLVPLRVGRSAYPLFCFPSDNSRGSHHAYWQQSLWNRPGRAAQPAAGIPVAASQQPAAFNLAADQLGDRRPGRADRSRNAGL